MGFRESFRNAFALDPPPPDPEMDSWIEHLADEVVRRRLGSVLLLFLGSSVPLAFAGSQLLLLVEPIVQGLFDLKSYPRLVHMLEDRTRVEQLLKAVERRIDPPAAPGS